MLIDILKMPPVLGLPVDRRMTLCTDPYVPQGILEPVLHWPMIPLHHKRLTIGSLIISIPSRLFKSIHVSEDGQYVFETVFGIEGTLCMCLYVKVITYNPVVKSTETHIAVSLNAIRYCRSQPNMIKSLSHFLSQEDAQFTGHYTVDPFQTDNAISMIVPPICGPEELYRHLNRLTDIQSYGFPTGRWGWMYKPVFDYLPGVMKALIDGYFTQSPFGEIRGYHPNIRIYPDKWYQYQNVAYREKVMMCDAQMHHPAFDTIALKALIVLPAKCSVTSLMIHALDGIKGLWLTREYQNPYHGLFHGMHVPETYHNLVAELSYACARQYCDYFQIDPEDFFQQPKDQSSITIVKNIYDEISITIHDMIHDKHLCFYTCLPVLALTTAAVGWYR